jgi:hypothetical protein
MDPAPIKDQMALAKVLNPLLRHLGVTFVIVAAGLGAALIVGNEVIAAVFAVMVSLGIFAAIARGTKTEEMRRSQKEKKYPFAYAFSWKLHAGPDLDQVAQSLERCGLTVEEPSSVAGLSLKGGSQLRTRLFGGYFVAPRYLPIKAQLKVRTDEAMGSKLELVVRDTLGIAVRDGALEERYEQAADSIRAAVEEGLEIAERRHEVESP